MTWRFVHFYKIDENPIEVIQDGESLALENGAVIATGPSHPESVTVYHRNNTVVTTVQNGVPFSKDSGISRGWNEVYVIQREGDTAKATFGFYYETGSNKEKIHTRYRESLDRILYPARGKER